MRVIIIITYMIVQIVYVELYNNYDRIPLLSPIQNFKDSKSGDFDESDSVCMYISKLL